MLDKLLDVIRPDEESVERDIELLSGLDKPVSAFDVVADRRRVGGFLVASTNFCQKF